MWKNTVEPYTPQMTIWRMRTSRWVPKATTTNPEYVIHIAHSNNGWRNAPQVLRYTYNACLFNILCFLVIRVFSFLSPIDIPHLYLPSPLLCLNHQISLYMYSQPPSLPVFFPYILHRTRAPPVYLFPVFHTRTSADTANTVSSWLCIQ